MLWTIFVLLLIIWFLGVISGYTISGFIHLLVIVVAAVLFRIIQDRKPL